MSGKLIHIECKNPILQRAFLTFIVQETINRGRCEMVKLGIPPKLIDTLCSAPYEDVLKMASKADLGVRFSFDEEALYGHINRMECMNDTERMCRYFIENGASKELVRSYFRISVKQFRELRKDIFPTDPPEPRRPRMPPPAIRDQIHQAWHEIKADSRWQGDERTQFYQLHLRFPDVPMMSIDMTLHEFDDDLPAAKKVGAMRGARL